MKASELRIGNLAMVDNKIVFAGSCETPSIAKKSNNWRLHDIKDEIFFYSLSQARPIPLTEEWLLRFDFEKDKEKGRHGYRYSIGYQDFRYVISKDWRETTSHHFGIWYIDSPRESDLTEVYNFAEQIIYVHQLQNLYFALTGEELTLKNITHENKGK